MRQEQDKMPRCDELQTATLWDLQLNKDSTICWWLEDWLHHGERSQTHLQGGGGGWCSFKGGSGTTWRSMLIRLKWRLTAAESIEQQVTEGLLVRPLTSRLLRQLTSRCRSETSPAKMSAQRRRTVASPFPRAQISLCSGFLSVIHFINFHSL